MVEGAEVCNEIQAFVKLEYSQRNYGGEVSAGSTDDRQQTANEGDVQ